MSQSQILEVLEHAKNGLTAAQLAEALGINYSTAQASCRKLRQWNEVDSLLALSPKSRTAKTYYYYAKGTFKKNARSKR